MKKASLSQELEHMKITQANLEMAIIQIGKDLITTSQRLALLKGYVEKELDEVKRHGRKSK